MWYVIALYVVVIVMVISVTAAVRCGGDIAVAIVAVSAVSALAGGAIACRKK